MGVHNLWPILTPTSHPVRLPSLARRRLAIDASIWIYQFLKAVRDKSGHSLSASHIVGFFRRICKLLYHGIQPVFVFDGGAPLLKRQTIARRKRRVEGRRVDAKEGARRVLALKLKRAAEEEAGKRRRRKEEEEGEEEPIPDDLVYVDELAQTPAQRQKERQKRLKRTDAYELPALSQELDQLNPQNDVRLMSKEELAEYAREFEGFDENSLNDYTNLDFSSPFFQQLPEADRYRILSHARVRSRLRMGYSKEQLDAMFPDRMAFSKFQIERLARRNELSQRLMNLQAGEKGFTVSRVAGEKGKEYVLVRNEGKEGGWVMSFVGNKQEEGGAERPIEISDAAERPVEVDDTDDEDAEFEDVPIEGLNREVRQRLKKQQTLPDALENEEARQMRRALYESLQDQQDGRTRQGDNDALFLGDDIDDAFMDDMNADDARIDEELRRAIAMSLGKGFQAVSNDDEDLQKAIQMSMEGSGKGKASVSTSPKPDAPDTITFTLDHRARHDSPETGPSSSARPQKSAGGLPAPLNLDLGKSSSFLMNKKVPALKKTKEQKEEEKNKKEEEKTIPLPPWFAKGPPRDVEAEVKKSKEVTIQDQRMMERERKRQEEEEWREEEQRRPSPAPQAEEAGEGKVVIDLENEDDDVQMEDVAKPVGGGDFTVGGLAEGMRAVPPSNGTDGTAAAMPVEQRQEAANTVATKEKGPGEGVTLFQSLPKQRRNAGRIFGQPVPPPAPMPVEELPSPPAETSENTVLADGGRETTPTAGGVYGPEVPRGTASHEAAVKNAAPSQPAAETTDEKTPTPEKAVDSDDEPLPWSDSEDESAPKQKPQFTTPPEEATPGGQGAAKSRGAQNTEASPAKSPPPPEVEDAPDDDFDLSFDHDTPPPEDLLPEDVEENELMEQMAREAEEHARFAASISNQAPPSSTEIFDASTTPYNTELSRLQAQQRRDLQGADEVSQTMVQEVQQLLTLFGLPYITAPMEAEAQCAELLRLGLVDGIVTDDSDVFLFGGTRVYRHMFNDQKEVQCYLLSDFERELALPRRRLIDAALLLGSDYTDGIPGIGPVTAVELLAEFPTLEAFRDWWELVQTGRPDPNPTPWRKKFAKANLAKIHIPPGFPDKTVVEAYLQPEVDSDTHPFSWGVPDLDGIREYFRMMMGWGQEKTDQVLLPVVRDMNRKLAEGTQRNLTAFFGEDGFAPRVRQQGSKRMEKAVAKLRGVEGAGEVGEDRGEGEGEGDGGKRKRPMSMREIAEMEERERREKQGESEEAEETAPKKKRKTAGRGARGRGRGKKGKA